MYDVDNDLVLFIKGVVICSLNVSNNIYALCFWFVYRQVLFLKIQGIIKIQALFRMHVHFQRYRKVIFSWFLCLMVFLL